MSMKSQLQLSIHPEIIPADWKKKEGTQRIQIGETELLVYYGEPKPYSVRQEIYISFLPRNEFVTAGVWKIQMMPGQVVDKLWQMWLPVQNALNIGTAFLKPGQFHNTYDTFYGISCYYCGSV